MQTRSTIYKTRNHQASRIMTSSCEEPMLTLSGENHALDWDQLGSKKTKWASHHCPLGHAWKARCFVQKHCEPCPIHLEKGVIPATDFWPRSGARCDGKEQAEEWRAKKGLE
jgi:hypothetical protein